MSERVWVVSEHRGEYSNYSVQIVAAFSSQQKANEFAAQQRLDDDAKRLSAREAGRPYYGPVDWEVEELQVDQLAVLMRHGTPHEAA